MGETEAPGVILRCLVLALTAACTVTVVTEPDGTTRRSVSIGVARLPDAVDHLSVEARGFGVLTGPQSVTVGYYSGRYYYFSRDCIAGFNETCKGDVQ